MLHDSIKVLLRRVRQTPECKTVREEKLQAKPESELPNNGNFFLLFCAHEKTGEV